MAQIVTITNPLTGQPAQVDQLEHTAQQIDDAITRALPGGAIDIALANKLGGIESTDYPGCYYRMVGSVVEWVNPPMQLGKEYRTTERYQGKPVYAKRILCESMPSGAGSVDIQPSATEVPNALISTAIVIRCYGRASVRATIPFYSGANDFMQVGVVQDCKIRLYTAKAYGGTAEITAYYVKTTD